MVAEQMDLGGSVGSPMPRPCSTLPSRSPWDIPPQVDQRLCEASLDTLCVPFMPHTRVCPAVLVPEPCPLASAFCPHSSHVYLCSDKSVVLFHSLFFRRQDS